MMVQGLETAPVVSPPYALSGNHHQVDPGQLALVMPKTLPHQPLDPVSFNRMAAVLLGNRQPQSGVGHAVGVGQH